MVSPHGVLCMVVLSIPAELAQRDDLDKGVMGHPGLEPEIFLGFFELLRRVFGS